MATYRLGVDIGGTFTDLILVDEQSGEMTVVKVPSTPRDPALGVLTAIRRIKERGADLERINFLVHGTTVATNTALQGAGAITGLITTKGYRDVLEFQKTNRTVLYDLFNDCKPPPLIPRHLRKEVPEREK